MPLPFLPMQLSIPCVSVTKYSLANLPTTKLYEEHTIIPVSLFFSKHSKDRFFSRL